MRSSIVARLLSVLLGTALFVACGGDDGVGDVRPLNDHEVVLVGFDPELPPYSFVDEDGELRGLTVDLMREVAEVAGLRFEARIAPTDELRSALVAGQIDVIPHAPSAASLEDELILSLPHSDVADGVFVRAESDRGLPAGGRTMTEWMTASDPIVLPDDPSWEFVSQLVPEERILLGSSPSESLRLLAAGRGDYALLPERTGLLLIRRLGLDHLQILPADLQAYSRGLCFAVRPEDRDLLGRLEQGTDILTRNGTYLRIYNEWEQYGGEELDVRLLAWILGPTLGLLLLSVAWTWSLRRQVGRRTAQLRAEEAERRRLQAQIQQSQKLESLGILAGGIAHDFNNLLMGILGNASLAKTRADDETLLAHLDDLEVAGRRAAELCQQMLAFSGKGRFVVEKLDLSRLVHEAVHHADLSPAPDADLEEDLASGLPLVAGDATQLRQLVEHLLENAFEALPDGRGIVSLATGARTCDASTFARTYLSPGLPEGEYVFFEIRDTGEGMGGETRERIFDPFFTTKFTGRGLGLAAALGIVRGHRGAIEVESRVGEGTTVRVFLPSADLSDLDAERPRRERREASPGPAAAGTSPAAGVADDVGESSATHERQAVTKG